MHAKAGRSAEAIAAYDHALELDRTHADAYVARGAAYANTERYREAVVDFECALRLQPGHSNARTYLQATRLKLQKREPSRSPPLHEIPRDGLPPTLEKQHAPSNQGASPQLPDAEESVAAAVSDGSRGDLGSCGVSKSVGAIGAGGASCSCARVDGNSATRTAVLERVVEVLAERGDKELRKARRREARSGGRKQGRKDKVKKHKRRDSEHKDKDSEREHRKRDKKDRRKRELAPSPSERDGHHSRVKRRRGATACDPDGHGRRQSDAATEADVFASSSDSSSSAMQT